MAPRPHVAIDGLLVLLVAIWGVNFSVLKVAFLEVPPLPFNALRLMVSVALFLGAIGYVRYRGDEGTGPVASVFSTPTPVTRRDWLELGALGIVGHFFDQIGFVGSVAATSISNAALIIGTTPVAVSLLSAALGRERLGTWHWAGAALSLAGLYVVVGLAASFTGATLHGDLLMLFAVLCWSIYTVGAGRLIARHSPLFVTGITMAIGAVPYVIWAAPQTMAHDWAAVSAWTWGALVFSAVLALNVSYLIWYIAVRQIGAARTAIVSNLVPVTAMAVAAVWLKEPITATKIVGATAILGGVALTRWGGRAPRS
jgi:drug/metabolite transporter (DMT)-like permease